MQVMIIPISEASVGYAQKIRQSLRGARLHVEVDATDKKMQKKVREAQLAQFNYILVNSPCWLSELSACVRRSGPSSQSCSRAA